MAHINYSKSIPVKKQYDVVVCGGGVAGVAAAVSSAKNGLSTLLLEKSNILGGLGTLGLINLFVPMCNGRGKQIIFGLAEKWLRMSAELGWDTIPEDWKNGEPKVPTGQRFIQRYSPAIFAYQLTEELKNAVPISSSIVWQLILLWTEMFVKVLSPKVRAAQHSIPAVF